MENIKKVLKEIKNRPAVYIGNLSLERLSLYLAGYEHACDKITNRRAYFNSYFQLYVQIKYKLNLTKHWSKFLSEGVSEEQAFELFYNLVEEMFCEWAEYFQEDCTNDDTLKTLSILGDELALLTKEIPILKCTPKDTEVGVRYIIEGAGDTLYTLNEIGDILENKSKDSSKPPKKV